MLCSAFSSLLTIHDTTPRWQIINTSLLALDGANVSVLNRAFLICLLLSIMLSTITFSYRLQSLSGILLFLRCLSLTLMVDCDSQWPKFKSADISFGVPQGSVLVPASLLCTSLTETHSVFCWWHTANSHTTILTMHLLHEDMADTKQSQWNYLSSQCTIVLGTALAT